MLEHSFIHIPGIGPQTERALWSAGCKTWTDALDGLSDVSFGSADRGLVRDALQRSIAALEDREHQYFARTLPSGDAWRALPAFQDRTVYLDIETDGGNGPGAITCVGLYDGEDFRCLVRGHDLYELPDRLSHFGMTVTFFGLSFDLPMIQKSWKHLVMDQIHLDLCPTLKKLNIMGGLKKIERQLGLARDDATDGLTGRDAIRLWRMYERGGRADALETLIAYNREDVVNLKFLAEYAYGRLRRSTFGELDPAYVAETDAVPAT
ncbi:MAG: ribonuclease H-like domain-containing protein [Fimbriimonadaceae bacterium]|nr:ribonuclease H-like domain-containing protein [Fimbriimonadaceae bacterium]